MKYLFLIATLFTANVKAKEMNGIADSKELQKLINELVDVAEDLGTFPTNGYFLALDGTDMMDYINATDFAENEFTCKGGYSTHIADAFMDKARYLPEGRLSQAELIAARDAIHGLLRYPLEVCYAFNGTLASESLVMILKNTDSGYKMLVEWDMPPQKTIFTKVELSKELKEAVVVFNKLVDSDGNMEIAKLEEYTYATDEDLQHEIERHLVELDYIPVTHINLDQDLYTHPAQSGAFGHASRVLEEYFNKKRGAEWTELNYSDDLDGFYTTIILNKKTKTVLKINWNSGE